MHLSMRRPDLVEPGFGLNSIVGWFSPVRRRSGASSIPTASEQLSLARSLTSPFAGVFDSNFAAAEPGLEASSNTLIRLVRV
jgi:hypothetical protein